MIFENTQLEVIPLPNDNSLRILLTVDTSISLEELNEMQFLTSESIDYLWQVRSGKHQLPLKQTEAWPYVYIDNIYQLEPKLFPLLQTYCVECACGDPDFETTVLEAGKLSRQDRSQAKKLCYEKNVDAVREWLSQLPLGPNELVYVARGGHTDTMLLPWKLFTKYWDTFYTFAGSLQIFDDTPGWFLYFHSEETAIWGCTEKYVNEKHLNMTAFRKLDETFRAYPREFVQADQEKLERCRKCLKLVLDEKSGL